MTSGDTVQTVWSERAHRGDSWIPAPSGGGGDDGEGGGGGDDDWGQSPGGLLGFVTEADGFETLVSGDANAYSFQEEADGFLTLDVLVGDPNALLISLNNLSLLTFLELT